jgi:hypothetical protein
MDARSIIESDSTGWDAIYFCGRYASGMLASGHTNLVAIAKATSKQAHSEGYQSSPDEKCTRFTKTRRYITKFQTKLYSVNIDPNWHFPDRVLCILWLIECGGPAMGRGPSNTSKGAEYQTDVEKYIGGTRKVYNRGDSRHGGPGYPESREYSEEECSHFKSPITD